MSNQTTQKHLFDINKAIELIVYMAKHAPRKDVYHIFKLLYFADKLHLEKYGRFVTGDHYVAMVNGPVPLEVRNIIDSAKGECWSDFGQTALAFELANSKGNDIVTASREPDLDWLSESDIECLDAVIQEYGNLSVDALKKLSHDDAYKKADLNGDISILKIAGTLQNSDWLIEYLTQ